MPDPNSKEDLLDVANLVSDINRLHAARQNDVTTNVMIARLLLSKHTAPDIFVKAEKFATSRHMKRAVGYNGSASLVDFLDVMNGTEGTEPGQLRLAAPREFDPSPPLRQSDPEAPKRAIQEHAPNLAT